MLTFSPTYQRLEVSDASEYLGFLCKLDAETPYMHYRSGERSMTDQGMRSRLKKQEKQGNCFVVVARGLDNSIIGYFSVNGGNSEATKHSATVAVGVLKAYQGHGVAKGLVVAAYGESIVSGVTRWECTVVTRNAEARGFYERVQFHQVGVFLNRFRSKEGNYMPEAILERLLV